jgi:hypothetical protein
VSDTLRPGLTVSLLARSLPYRDSRFRGETLQGNLQRLAHAIHGHVTVRTMRNLASSQRDIGVTTGVPSLLSALPLDCGSRGHG